MTRAHVDLIPSLALQHFERIKATFIPLVHINCPRFASLITLVCLYDPSARLASHVTATDVLAVASLQDVLGPSNMTTSAAKISAALVTGTTAVTLSVKFF